jgi:hypothetical protein
MKKSATCPYTAKKMVDLAGVCFIEGEVPEIDIQSQNVMVQQKVILSSFHYT